MRRCTLRMSHFKILEWKHIALTEEQKKHRMPDIKELVKQWEISNSTPKDRVWDLKKMIKVQTYAEQPCILTPVDDTPANLVCMPPPADAKEMLLETKLALDLFFSHVADSNSKFAAQLHHERDNYVVNLAKAGFTIFNFNSTKDYEKHGRVSSPKEIRAFLQSTPEFKVIDDFWSTYMSVLVEHFAATTKLQRSDIESLINDHGDFCIIKYRPGFGLYMHIDNLLRSDATVFTVGLGRKVVYDMTRVIGREPGEPGDSMSIIRSSNPEGTMMVLDGEARYKWGHAIPYSTGKDGVKYTIILRLFHTPELSQVVGECAELRTTMYSTTSSTKAEPRIDTHHHSLLGLLMQLENTRINTHIPERIKRPGLPRLHPRPGWL